MKQEKYENRKQLISAGIWSLAVLAVVAVGMLTFFSSASRAAKEQQTNNRNTAVTEAAAQSAAKQESGKTKGDGSSSANAESGAEAGLFKPANPIDTDIPGDPEPVQDNPVDGSEKTKDASVIPEGDTSVSVKETFSGSAVFTSIMPIDGTVTKAFTDDIAVYSLTMNDYRVHSGVDIYAPVGTNVKACAAGVVERVWEDPFMGCCLEIDHGGGMKSLYANLSGEFPRGIEAGATVLAGDVIGGVGSTMVIEMADTDHLHFALSKDGMYIDPMAYMTNYRDTVDTGYEN